MTTPIYCIGGANIDKKLKSEKTLIPNTSNPVDITQTFGGVARNVAENLARWTKNIYLQCVVGKDEEGKRLLANMHQMGVNIEHSIMLDNKKTSSYYAVLNPNGDLHIALAEMDIYHHIPLFPFTNSWNNWAENSLIFLDNNLPHPLIERALQQAAEKNLKVFIDPVSVPKANALPKRLDNVFLIKPDLLEAAALADMSIYSIPDCVQAAKKILARGVENVVVSLGKSGYVLVNSACEEYFPMIEFSEVIDVSGAGDAFFSGILYGLQQGHSIESSCQMGAAAAAYTVQSPLTVAEDITVSRLQAFVHNQKIIKEQTHAAPL